MSDAAQGRSRAIDYVVAQLERNPQMQSGEIIALRARALKIVDKRAAASAGGAEQANKRKLIAQQLEVLRGQCFKSPVELVEQKLDKLPLANYPDLAALATRLRTLLAVRSRLPQLSQHADFDGDFWSVFRDVLTSKPAEVAVLRERVLASFSKPKIRKRGRKMIALLQQQAPELYALERSWLESLVRFRRDATSAVQQSQERTASLVGVLQLLGAVLGFFIITGAIVAAFGEGESNNRRRARPYPTTVPARPYVPPPTRGPEYTPFNSPRSFDSTFDDEVEDEDPQTSTDDNWPSSFPRPRRVPMPTMPRGFGGGE